MKQYKNLDHLLNPTMRCKQIIAASYLHRHDHIIEIGGGESPIAPHLLEYSTQPKSYVNIDPRFDRGDKHALNHIYYPRGYRTVHGKHHDVGTYEMERCVNQGGTIGLVILSASVKDYYPNVLGLCNYVNTIVYECRVGRDLEIIKNFADDIVWMGFEEIVNLRYLSPQDDERQLLVYGNGHGF